MACRRQRARTKPCTVCHHPERLAIDLALCRGVAATAVARRYDGTEHPLKHDAVNRHRKLHISEHLRRSILLDLPDPAIDLRKLHREESTNLLARLVAHRARLNAHMDAAEEYRDLNAAAKLHDRLLRLWELEARFLGELAVDARHQSINIAVNPTFVAAREAIMEELVGEPELAQRIANRLRQLDTVEITPQLTDLKTPKEAAEAVLSDESRR